MSCLDPGTFSLHQTKFCWILPPNTTLNCIILPYPILYFNEHQEPVSLDLPKIVNPLNMFLENDDLQYSSQRHIPIKHKYGIDHPSQVGGGRSVTFRRTRKTSGTQGTELTLKEHASNTGFALDLPFEQLDPNLGTLSNQRHPPRSKTIGDGAYSWCPDSGLNHIRNHAPKRVRCRVRCWAWNVLHTSISI